MNALQQHLVACHGDEGYCDHLFELNEAVESNMIPASFEELRTIASYERKPQPLRVGQIWVVRSERALESGKSCPVSLMLVIGLHNDRVRVLPVSKDTWAATERDLIVDSVFGQAMVATWNPLSVEESQLWFLHCVLGSKDMELIRQMMSAPRLLLLAEPPLSSRIGDPITDREDDRVEFHGHELARISAFRAQS